MKKGLSGCHLGVREKFFTQGVSSLSDLELLTAFISSGSAGKSCMQMAMDLLEHFGDLRALLNADFYQFNSISGFGKVKYVQLQALKELCRRSDFIELQKEVCLDNSRQTHIFLKRRLRDKKNETFVGVFLDNQHRLLAYEELFQGTINSAVIHTRPVIAKVLQLNAAALILAHNHPSGHVSASQQDLEVTDKLKHALALIDVRLLDHLIVGDNEVYSIVHQMRWMCH